MTDEATEQGYETIFDTSLETTTIDPQDVLVVETPNGGQLSEIDIDGENAETWQVDERDTDSSNPTTRRHYRGTDIEKGSFDDPELEVGAGKEIAIRNTTSATSGNTYAINVRVDRYNVTST